jgi:hypothetical protein
MIYAHIFVDGEILTKTTLPECPRNGDTIRFGGSTERYAKVTEIIWCLNEQSMHGYRVNIRTESEKP